MVPERKAAVFGSNLKVVSSHSKTISTEGQNIQTKVDGFVKAASQHLHKVKSEAEQFQTKEIEALAAISARLKEQLEKVQESVQLIHAKEEASKEAIETIRTTIGEAQQNVKTGFSTYAEALKMHCEAMCQEAETSTAASCTLVSGDVFSATQIADHLF